jgi:hypothetical protein
MRQHAQLAAVVTVCLLGFQACAPTIPPAALQLSSESLQQRQLQTRRFDTQDEELLLAASAGVLQDLGFTIDNSETKVGLVFATKERDATEAGQVAGAIVMAVLFGVATAIDRDQTIRVSLITRPEGVSSINVRVTFQRMVRDTQGRISKIESLSEPELYAEFFDRLSQSVFLTAHQI